jgi:hypothetical protein
MIGGLDPQAHPSETSVTCLVPRGVEFDLALLRTNVPEVELTPLSPE